MIRDPGFCRGIAALPGFDRGFVLLPVPVAEIAGNGVKRCSLGKPRKIPMHQPPECGNTDKDAGAVCDFPADVLVVPLGKTPDVIETISDKDFGQAGFYEFPIAHLSEVIC